MLLRPQDLYLVRLQLMLGTYSRQLRWEADAAARHGDVALAVERINKFADVELRLATLKDDYCPQGIGTPLANFLAIHGESASLERISELSATELARRVDPIPSHYRLHEYVLRYEEDVQTYNEIRRAVAQKPGLMRASLGVLLGARDQKHVEELVHNLCCEQELVATKVGARICLWPADDGQELAEARRTSGSLWDFYGEGESEKLTADELGQLCSDYEKLCSQGLEEVAAHPYHVTFLDIACAPSSANYIATGGAPILFGFHQEAIAWGHMDVRAFKKVAKATYRAEMNEPVPKWGRDPARQTWVVLATRDQFGKAYFREVPQGHPVAFPIMLLTTADRSTDPEGPFVGRHAWMTDDERLLDLDEWRAREEADFLSGQDAVSRLLTARPDIDAVVPVRHHRSQVLELQFFNNSARTIEVEPALHTWSDDCFRVWLLGPDRNENLRALAESRVSGEPWYPLGRVCLISEEGNRLVNKSEKLSPVPGVKGSYVDRHTWVEHRPRSTAMTWSRACGYEAHDLAALIEDFLKVRDVS